VDPRRRAPLIVHAADGKRVFRADDTVDRRLYGPATHKIREWERHKARRAAPALPRASI
jgi:hypothetical protein